MIYRRVVSLVVEHLLYKQKVTGSNLVLPYIDHNILYFSLRVCVGPSGEQFAIVKQEYYDL